MKYICKELPVKYNTVDSQNIAESFFPESLLNELIFVLKDRKLTTYDQFSALITHWFID